MADGPGLALQKALVATLKADATLAALVGARVYDEPPQPVTRPFVRIGNVDVRPERAAAVTAWAVTFSVEGHSRPKQGRVEATRIAEAIVAALDGQHGSITVAGFTFSWCDFAAQTVIRDSDGKSYAANIAFEAMLDV